MAGSGRDLRLEVLLEGFIKKVAKAREKFIDDREKLNILDEVQEILEAAIRRSKSVPEVREIPQSVGQERKEVSSPQKSQEAAHRSVIEHEILRNLVREAIERIMDLF
jgi:hypothetical protein